MTDSRPGSVTDRSALVEGIRTVYDLVANQPWQNDKPGPVKYKHGPTRLGVKTTDRSNNVALSDE